MNMKRQIALCLLVTTSFFDSALNAQADPGSAIDAAIEAAINKPDRLVVDIERDKRSRPEEIIPLLNLAQGDRVVDIFGSGGYYSELLASVVGEDGEVLLHNTGGFKAWGVNILNDRFENRSPGNIVLHDREIGSLDLGENTLDGAIMVMAYHDLYVVPSRYNGERYVPVGRPANVEYIMQQVLLGLKPGARLVIVDHAGDPHMSDFDVAELHRIKEDLVKTDLERFGFRLVGSSDALRNRGDSLQDIVFDEHIQGRTDRFALAFEKPMR